MAAKKRKAKSSTRKACKNAEAAPGGVERIVCNARGREVEIVTGSGQRYRAMSEIVHDVVASCEGLPEISHLDQTTLPQADAVIRIVDLAREIFFPGYYGERGCTRENLAYHIGDRLHQFYLVLAEQIYRSVRHECRREGPECPHCKGLAEANAQEVLRRIPEIRRKLVLDVRAAYDGDPAARSFHEIILGYPGLFAISVYRLAHELWDLGVPMLPRMMTEHAHTLSGIDIHPGATIGESFFIDHGTGVVVGETTVIGNNVKLYQGVTLGALSFPKDACGKLIRGQKRHPTIEDNVTIYAQATILGGTAVIGAGSTIGGNVWLTQSVPPHSIVTAENPRPEVRSKQRD